jgi:hypothetical protein
VPGIADDPPPRVAATFRQPRDGRLTHSRAPATLASARQPRRIAMAFQPAHQYRSREHGPPTLEPPIQEHASSSLTRVASNAGASSPLHRYSFHHHPSQLPLRLQQRAGRFYRAACQGVLRVKRNERPAAETGQRASDAAPKKPLVPVCRIVPAHDPFAHRDTPQQPSMANEGLRSCFPGWPPTPLCRWRAGRDSSGDSAAAAFLATVRDFRHSASVCGV